MHNTFDKINLAKSISADYEDLTAHFEKVMADFEQVKTDAELRHTNKLTELSKSVAEALRKEFESYDVSFTYLNPQIEKWDNSKYVMERQFDISRKSIIAVMVKIREESYMIHQSCKMEIVMEPRNKSEEWAKKIRHAVMQYTRDIDKAFDYDVADIVMGLIRSYQDRNPSANLHIPKKMLRANRISNML